MKRTVKKRCMMICSIIASGLLIGKLRLSLSAEEDQWSLSEEGKRWSALNIVDSPTNPVYRTGGRFLNASNIHISVKTTTRYHEQRLAPAMKTWMQLVEPKQIHIITDKVDKWKEVAIAAGFNIIATECEKESHSRISLWCKSGFEHQAFFDERDRGENFKWFCHFDDDTYVNVPKLAETLAKYNPTQEYIYLGQQPPKLLNHSFPIKSYTRRNFPKHKANNYQYAAGASYCISVALMEEIENFTRGRENFENTCSKVGLPDDVCVGCIIGGVLGHCLTSNSKMKSHNQNMRLISPKEQRELITWGYKLFGGPMNGNYLTVPKAVFTPYQDPTRFFSYHCFLFPETNCTHEFSQ